ncbi:hypothetical protein [Algicola sagamiensis]|uniref:hypothetical protein n=1 Tax=Algicola sagamiensis TaxID=163869 RepID=UPI00036E1156|nr:hypothetical protein [Algicola sagamiensis]
MKNKLTDLNNHLFAQLERLNDEDLSDEELQMEIARSKAISGVAQNIVSNAKLALDAQQRYHEGMIESAPVMLEVKSS